MGAEGFKLERIANHFVARKDGGVRLLIFIEINAERAQSLC